MIVVAVERRVPATSILMKAGGATLYSVRNQFRVHARRSRLGEYSAFSNLPVNPIGHAPTRYQAPRKSPRRTVSYLAGNRISRARRNIEKVPAPSAVPEHRLIPASDGRRITQFLYQLIDCRLKLLRRHRLDEMHLEPGGTAAFDISLHSVPAECDAW